jgi:nicotinamide mononucleotide adenylyltransferase
LLQGTAAVSLLEMHALYISNMISLTDTLVTGMGITTLPRQAFPQEYQHPSAMGRFQPFHQSA